VRFQPDTDIQFTTTNAVTRAKSVLRASPRYKVCEELMQQQLEVIININITIVRIIINTRMTRNSSSSRWRMRTQMRMRIFSRRFLLHLCHTETRMTAKRLLQQSTTTKRLNLTITMKANGVKVKSGMMQARAAAVGEDQDHTSKFDPFFIVRIPKNSCVMTSAAAVVRRLLKTIKCSNEAPHHNGIEDDEK
jgi:hypothetical protein